MSNIKNKLVLECSDSKSSIMSFTFGLSCISGGNNGQIRRPNRLKCISVIHLGLLIIQNTKIDLIMIAPQFFEENDLYSASLSSLERTRTCRVEMQP